MKLLPANRMLALATQRLSTLKQAHLTPQKLLMLSQQALPLLTVQKAVLAQLQNPHLLLHQKVPQARPRRPLQVRRVAPPRLSLQLDPPPSLLLLLLPWPERDLETPNAQQTCTPRGLLNPLPQVLKFRLLHTRQA